MPVINITVLQDILGGTEVADAVITATVNRASIDAYRVSTRFVVFPRDIKINVTAGEPDVPFVLTTLPASYYWHIDVFVNGEAPLRRTVIVPEGSGPFDFEDLIDVDPGTAQPDTSQDLYQAWLDQILAAVEAIHGVPVGGTAGQVLTKIDSTDYNTQWVSQSSIVGGAPVRYTPAFTATGLAYTGSGTTHPCYNSYYSRVGSMVSFYIEVNLSTVTNFGTGQLNFQLPFMPHGSMMNHFSGWVNVDPAVNPDNAGHVILNADHLVGTKTLDMHYIKQSGGANSPIMEAIFRQGTPVTLTTSSKIYINGTYITSE